MTIKEMIEELNALIANGEVNENAIVVNQEMDDIVSIVGNVYEVIIYS